MPVDTGCSTSNYAEVYALTDPPSSSTKSVTRMRRILTSPFVWNRYLDVPRLIAWLSSRQYAPEGGLSGRTNKLVDGCYSHWIGGCWPLIEACLRGSNSPASDATAAAKTLVPNKESLFSREGLIRYTLCCCQDQSRRGGLRDKPSR
jgi:protein farnesyltransferase subunit beta